MPTPNDILVRLHAQALGYPDAYEEEPWGHPAIKVRKKAFVFCSRLDATEPSVSVKLPGSAGEARQLPGVKPTEYGLGRHGWCTAQVSEEIGIDRYLDWIDESYRAIAPKTLVKKLGAERPPPAAIAPSNPDAEELDEIPRVLLVGDGAKRLERAERGLAAHGIATAQVTLDAALDAAGTLEPDVIVVDMGRRGSAAEPLLIELAILCPDAQVLAVGAAKAADGTEPPGDPAVLQAVRDSLSEKRPAHR